MTEEKDAALSHITKAEAAAKASAAARSIDGKQAVPLQQVVVVGGGNMGASIAYAFSVAGINTTVVEIDSANCQRAQANVDRLINTASKRGLFDDDTCAAIGSRLSIVEGYRDLPAAELAIEAVYEDISLKKEVLATLEANLPETAILASNTSYLDINEIAGALERPAQLIGLHFFSPAHIMKLLEIVYAEKSGDQAMAMACTVATRLRKVPVVAGVCDGFIGNRILARYREAADTLLMDGATPWEIDEAMVEFGYKMGPYEAQDLSGLDIAYANRQRQAPVRDPQRRYIPIADRMVQEGRLGRKSGVGWYRYPGGGGKVVDPLLEDMITEEAYFAKVVRREFTAAEIRERLIVAMINEAMNILDEGIAQHSSDIDLVLVHGYGFPRRRGGLMFHAEALGLDWVSAKLQEYAIEDPHVWQPAAFLERQCSAGNQRNSEKL